MTDSGSIARDIQLLYELSLSIGRGFDLQRTCGDFVQILLTHKNISYAAVWLDSVALGRGEDSDDVELVYAMPRSRAAQTRLPRNHASFVVPEDSFFACIGPDDPDHAEVIEEANVERATYAVIRLGAIGWLKLCSSLPSALEAKELRKLRSVIGKLSTAIEASLVHDKLVDEIRVRKSTEGRLAASLLERQAITESVADVLCMLDERGRLAWWNGRLCEVTAKSDDELRQGAFRELVDAADREVVDSVLSGIVSEGRGNFEATFHTGPEPRVHEFTGVRLERGNAEAAAVVLSGRDVTESRRDAAERIALEKQVQHAQKLESLGVLAGGIAHDFNNILVGILGNAELAAMEIPDDSPAQESLSSLMKAATRAAELCRQMLAYSGKGSFVVERKNLSELLRDVLPLVEAGISKSIELRYDLDSDTRVAPLVEVDVTQIRQIMLNLITNAAEAIGDAEGVITIATGVVELREEQPPVVAGEKPLPSGMYSYFKVGDTGCGMDDVTIGRIFEPFFTTKFTGRGLGLAAVLGIVRGHRGGIFVESTPGQGSSFRVLLPACGGSLDGERSASTRGKHQDARSKLASASVLIIDDEPTVRSVASQMLERNGFNVFLAADGREGLDIFAASPDQIDAVLLDLTMPGQNGESVLRELRAIRDDIRVVLMSGYDESETERIQDERPTTFLSKPFQVSELLQALDATRSS